MFMSRDADAEYLDDSDCVKSAEFNKVGEERGGTIPFQDQKALY
jgi:hypothetical protein